MNNIPPTIKLNTGAEIPRVGLGVWKIDNTSVVQAVSEALKAGYRHIDTAKVYGNEMGVGQAIKASKLKRSQIFVTTKLAVNDIHNPVPAIEESLSKLGLDYVDLYLIHWPFLGWKSAWKHLEEFYRQGKAKAIGVSNFNIRQLREINKFGTVTPAVNQIEISPFLSRRKTIDYCQKEGIVVEAYSPLTRGKRLGDAVLSQVAAAYKKTPAQIMLRWGLQCGLVVLPKSANPEHINSNLNIFNFEISAEDIQKLNALNEESSQIPLWSRG
jgi:methylglyoxal/glyoxal reductase